MLALRSVVHSANHCHPLWMCLVLLRPEKLLPIVEHWLEFWLSALTSTRACAIFNHCQGVAAGREQDIKWQQSLASLCLHSFYGC